MVKIVVVGTIALFLTASPQWRPTVLATPWAPAGTFLGWGFLLYIGLLFCSTLEERAYADARAAIATIVKNISSSAFRTSGDFKKTFEGYVKETRIIHLRTHQKNIDRYQALLKSG
jgi:hypothetical protein